MHEAILVMISCDDKSQAEQIGEQLLKHKLAACTQIVNHADSMFLWPPRKNQIDYADESLLLVKTLDEKWAKLEREVLSHHTYENPEIIAIPLTHVTKRYLLWLKSELS
jgi:periplasmic divalent cation tolerance protein